MSTNKSDKELAFLRDLYVAPDWGERFVALIDEHVELPKKGRVLYVGAGTGGHALALLERAGKDVALVCVDESAEALELARAKAAALRLSLETHQAQLETLPFEDDEFDLVLGDASLVRSDRLPEMLREMARVARVDAPVALCAITASSYGEFFSIYWEALNEAGLDEHAAVVEELISELPTVATIETIAAREGLDRVESWTSREEFDYESGAAFLDAPLIKDFLMKNWLEGLPNADARERVAQQVARIIDDERRGADFAFSIKATLLAGRKAD